MTMPILDQFSGSKPVTMETMTAVPKDNSITSPKSPIHGENTVPSGKLSRGVEAAQAVTLTWSKKYLILTFVLIWLMFLVNGFRIYILATLLPFATSSFYGHSLLATIGIVASSMTAAVYIPLAKVLDIWGRAEGFLLMIGCATLGMILMAASNSISTFCAAQVFYSVGFAGVIYSIEVIAIDSSNLRNRGIAFAFTSSPYMITAFAGTKAATEAYYNVGWRWGFGAFAIITPVVAAPLYANLKINFRKAVNQGMLQTEREHSGRTFLQNFRHWAAEFDVLGVILFAGGLIIFLLPFTLASTAPHGWKTGYIVAMIVVGFVLLILFGLYERFLAPIPFLNWQFLADRTVAGACLIDATYQVSYYCWASYFTSFLQVVYNQTTVNAGYINSTFSVVSGVLLFCIGLLIRRTGHFKWLFYIAAPLYTFALGLMIYFRQPNGEIGFIIMCEIFTSIGGAIFILNCQLAVLAAVDHQHTAAVISLLFVSGTVGGAIGQTICGAVWTNTFESALIHYLPDSALPDLASIYGSLVTQLSYPVGSPTRLAIQEAYGYAQARMLAAGTAIAALNLIWMFLLRDLNVKTLKQTKGVVF